MKTAYELAMERLNKAAPEVKLNSEQKKALADLDALYKAKVAERELGLQAEVSKLEAAGDFENAEKTREQLLNERKKLQAELEDKKQQVRHSRQ